MTPKFICGLMVAALLVSGCSTRSKTSVKLGPEVWLELSQRGSGPGLALTQQIRIESKGRTFQFLSHGEIEADRLTLVGLTPLGTRAFSLSWDGQTLDFEKLPFYRLPIKPKQLLAAYQMTYWPTQRLQEHLGPNTKVQPHEKTKGRLFRNQKGLLAKVAFSNDDPFSGRAICHLLEYGLKITFDTRYKELLQ